MDATLRSYLRHNGTFRSNDLLKAAFETAPRPAEGMAWVISLSGAASDPAAVLNDIGNVPWLSPSQRETVLKRELVLVQRDPTNATDTGGEAWRIAGVRSKLIQLYLDNRQGAQALALLQNAPAARRAEAAYQEEEIVASAQTGALSALLQRFDAQPYTKPDAAVVKTTATTLQREGDASSARAVLEWQLRRAERTRQASSSDYLAVAEARLHTGDPNGAAAVLRTLIAGSEDADADGDAAAALLENNGHAAEAIPFLEPLASGVPWDLSYRVRLAEAQTASGTALAEAKQMLHSVAADPAASYDLRATAARDLKSGGKAAVGLGSAELNLLAAGSSQPAAARQPFFTEARADAAAASKDPKVQAMLLREALNIAPYANDAQSFRKRLFAAEQQIGDFEGAKAVLESILTQENSNWNPASPEADNAGAAATEPSAVAMPMPESPDATSPERQASFARGVSQVYAKTGQPSLARAYLLRALEIAPSGPEAVAAKQQLAALAQAQRLRAANAARRPQIAKQLDQPKIVRTRLKEAPEALAPATEVDDE